MTPEAPPAPGGHGCLHRKAVRSWAFSHIPEAARRSAYASLSRAPARQRTVFLEHQKAPRQLDQPTSYPRITGLGQALLSAFQAALVGRSREPGVACHRSSISKLPRQDLPHMIWGTRTMLAIGAVSRIKLN
jgi:hypothetical protein